MPGEGLGGVRSEPGCICSRVKRAAAPPGQSPERSPPGRHAAHQLRGFLPDRAGDPSLAGRPGLADPEGKHQLGHGCVREGVARVLEQNRGQGQVPAPHGGTAVWDLGYPTCPGLRRVLAHPELSLAPLGLLPGWTEWPRPVQRCVGSGWGRRPILVQSSPLLVTLAAMMGVSPNHESSRYASSWRPLGPPARSAR